MISIFYQTIYKQIIKRVLYFSTIFILLHFVLCHVQENAISEGLWWVDWTEIRIQVAMMNQRKGSQMESEFNSNLACSRSRKIRSNFWDLLICRGFFTESWKPYVKNEHWIPSCARSRKILSNLWDLWLIEDFFTES